MKTGTPIYRGISALWTTTIVGAMWDTQKNPMLKQSGLNSEPTLTHSQSPKFPFGTPHNRIFLEYIIRNPCVIRITYSGTHLKNLAGGLHHKENIFQMFLDGGYTFFDCIDVFPTVFGPSLPFKYASFPHNFSHPLLSPLLLFLLLQCVSIVGLS